MAERVPKAPPAHPLFYPQSAKGRQIGARMACWGEKELLGGTRPGEYNCDAAADEGNRADFLQILLKGERTPGSQEAVAWLAG